MFVGISLYQIKHFITKKEIELRTINKKIIETRSDLEILRAELSYLKRPDRIEQIALNKLQLREILPTDIWSLKDIVEASKTVGKSKN